MCHARTFLSIVLLSLCCASSIGRADDAPDKLDFEPLGQLRERTKGETSGIAVLLARDGKVLFQGGFGLANIAEKTPVTAETKFRIGSVSKQFTAAAILRLVEKQKLSLDDPLARFYPDFPRGDHITIRHLLTHTSGIHSYTDKPEFISRVKQPIEPADLVSWFRNDPPDFAPGQGFHYNNSAYFLLGEIVGKVAEQPFGEFLRHEFFEPLGMNATGVYRNIAPPEGMAIGYSQAENKLEPALDWDMSWAGGAGALYSTVGDLYRWNEALYGGRVMGDGLFRAATTPVSLPPDVDGMKYGYGLVLFDVKRLPAIGHGGGLNGWSSDLVRVPAQRCTVVVLGNALPPPPGLVPRALSLALVEAVLADEIKKLPELVADTSVDSKTFGDYVGQYDYQRAIMTVTVENNALFAQLSGQPKHSIFAKPNAKDTFFWKVTDAEVTFARDGAGKVVAARHTQGGSTLRAAKLDDSIVQLTAEQVAPFVGQYLYGLGSILTVTNEGPQLFAQLTGQPKYPILPTSPTEFQWRVVKASVEFVKDDEGKVVKAIHRQNGGVVNAPKFK